MIQSARICLVAGIVWVAFGMVACRAAGQAGVAKESRMAAMPAEKEFANSIGMRLVRIEPGRFIMGRTRPAILTRSLPMPSASRSRSIWAHAR